MLRSAICNAIYKSGRQQKEVALSLGFDEQSFSKMLSGTLRFDVDVFETLILRVLGLAPLTNLIDRLGFKLVPKERSKEEILGEIEIEFDSLKSMLDKLREEIRCEQVNYEQPRESARVYSSDARRASKRDGSREPRGKTAC